MNRRNFLGMALIAASIPKIKIGEKTTACPLGHETPNTPLGAVSVTDVRNPDNPQPSFVPNLGLYACETCGVLFTRSVK